MEKLGLYIHIPFCEKKCYYCDFTSIIGDSEIIKRYIESLLKEIKSYKNYSDLYEIDTIFIGGGTPSAIDGDFISEILKTIKDIFKLDNDCEISIEVNPGTINPDKALIYKKAGINRISLGIQSMNDKELSLLGRIHKSKEVVDSIKMIKQAGINNINGDLMFGLPYQNTESFVDNLKELLKLDLTHISMYGLIIEEGTLMNYWYRKGLINLPDEDEERRMYHLGRRILSENCFNQYEISNFSIDGYECRHNIGYWKLKPYLGFGLSAHSNIDKKRYWNHKSFKEYFKALDDNKLPIAGYEDIDRNLEIGEYMILGLRMTSGINKTEFLKKFNVDIYSLFSKQIQKNINKGLLVDNIESIYLTEKGLDLSNQVEIDFLL